jgi:hypothetical protein
MIDIIVIIEYLLLGSEAISQQTQLQGVEQDK